MTARHVATRNTYEELPDELKDVLNNNGGEEGKALSRLDSRELLLRDHQYHLDLLNSSNVQPRKLTLPPPYPPARTEISAATWTRLNDLCIDTHHTKQAICLRVITKPYVHSSSIVVVEDESGNAARLTVHNLEDSPIDNVFSEGSILVVRQPCWSKIVGGGRHIRVDHPSDLVQLDLSDSLVPLAWRSQKPKDVTQNVTTLKKEGDMMFLKKKFRKALQLYKNGLACLTTDSDNNARIDMYRKICGVNIVLLRFDDAAESLAQAISIHMTTSTNGSDSHSDNLSYIRSWLHDHTLSDSNQITSSLPKPLKDLASRIKYDIGVYQDNSEYDLPAMSAYVGPLTLHVDASNYVCDTELKDTKHQGRGLFAKRNFKAGDLVLAEKAFAMPGYFFNDPGSECAMYNLGDDTAADRSGTWLFKELVQKLEANPSLRRSFFDLHDGGYWAKNGYDIEEGDDIPVDVFRIDQIRRRNCFAAPLRSLDILTRETPVRNGFWIHTSYINHSCLPNSARTFIGDVLLLRATRDITAGEEITAQYLSPDLRLKDRQESFQGTWGFKCTCALCSLDSDNGEDLENKRMEIFEELKSTAQKLGSSPSITALKKFTRRLRDLEALYDGNQYTHLPKLCLVHPMLFLTEAWRNLKQTDKMLECGFKLLRNFGIETSVLDDNFMVTKNSGLINVECVRVLKYISEGYKLKGQNALADQILVVTKVWFRIITGADVDSQVLLGA